MMKKAYLYLLLFFLFFIQISSCWAEVDPSHLRDDNIERERSNLQNGVRIVMNLCSLCHSLKYVKFRDLMEIGVSANKIDKIRGNRKLNDAILSRMTTEQMTALFGMTTPDLSLMAKARKNGPQYIYSLLLAYDEHKDGTITNSLFPGLKMPDVFAYSIENSDVARSTIEQNARDVAAFLAWTSDPREEERRTLGIYVIAYLCLLTLLLYLVKRKTWAKLKPYSQSS